MLFHNVDFIDLLETMYKEYIINQTPSAQKYARSLKYVCLPHKHQPWTSSPLR